MRISWTVFKLQSRQDFVTDGQTTMAKTIWAASWQNNKMIYAPSEDSDQPGLPPSLIRVFAVRMKKAWVLSYPLSAQRRLWSDWAEARLIWVFAGPTVILLVLSWGGSYLPTLKWGDIKLSLQTPKLVFATRPYTNLQHIYARDLRLSSTSTNGLL